MGLRRIAVICVVTGLVGLTPSFAAADNSMKAQIAQLHEQMDGLGVEEATALSDLDQAVVRQNKIALDVKAVDGEISEIKRDVSAAQDVFDAANRIYIRENKKYQAKLEEVEASRKRVMEQAADVFTGSGAGNDSVEIGVVLDATSISDAARRTVILDAVALHHKNVLDENIRLKNEAKVIWAKAKKAKELAEEKRDEIVEKELVLHAKRGSLAALNNKAASEAKRQADIIEGIRGQRVAYEQRIISLQQESNAIGDLIRDNQSEGGFDSKGGMLLPVAGSSITSPFGYRYHPIYHTTRLHAGVDIRGTTGTPIRAAQEGKVIFTGVKSGYGNTTIVDHGGGIATLYAHQSAIVVRIGQHVNRGTFIGQVGATGNVTGPHLHWEVRKNGTPVNPINYL